MRMRRRRAERCVLRAQVALEAGFPEDAREALDEARRLDSSTPAFETLCAAVVGEVVEVVPEAPARQPRSLVPLISVAAVLVAVVAGVGTFFLSSGTRTTASQAPDAVQSAPLARAQEPTAPLPAAVGRAATPAEHAFNELPRAPVTKERERRPREASTPTPIATRLAATVPIGKASPKPKPDPPVVAESRPPESRNVEPAAIRLEPAQPLVLPSSGGPSLTLPEAPAPDERPRVRAALARYEAGYSALNVAAVQAVWPAVDARSLSRAFDGLASQRFTLGQCSMAIETASATATCNGTASWTPKIGGGVSSEGRRWIFDLRRVDGGWQIVRVSTR